MKKRIAIAIVCIVIAGMIGGLFLLFSNYVILNGKIVNREAEHIELTGNEMPSFQKLHRFEEMKSVNLAGILCSVEEYEALRAEFPDCDIRWQVPFHGEYFDSMITVLPTVNFDESDIDMLRYFPELETVDARGCNNFDVLLKLQDARPDLSVIYEI